MITKVSKGYQITIPANWRKFLGLKIDSQINIELNKKKKQVTIEPLDSEAPDFKDLWKEADKYENKFTIKDLKKIEDNIYD